MNSIGKILTLTTFGESHGPAAGGVLDGVPAGAVIDMARLQEFVDRRRPAGQFATSRRESDTVEILSGLFGGKTLGTPIGFIIRNNDTRAADYSAWADAYRPCHADYTYEAKYGIRDYRGGGRASARETVARVVAGGIASQILASQGITVRAFTSAIGTVSLPADYVPETLAAGNHLGCPDPVATAEMEEELARARAEGDTLGGTVTCLATGVLAGLGDPVFGKLQARLAAAMMSIPAAKGFDYGDGFAAAAARGSEIMDSFNPDFSTVTNHSGGIQGGITNGADIRFRVAFKPIATLMRDIDTVDRHGNRVTIQPRGRHDVTAVPRAVVVVEAMAALTILDSLLLDRCSRL